MSTDADELAKRIGGIKLRQIAVLVVGCGVVMGAVSGTVAAYKALGGPIPASRERFSNASRRTVLALARFLPRFPAALRHFILQFSQNFNGA